MIDPRIVVFTIAMQLCLINFVPAQDALSLIRQMQDSVSAIGSLEYKVRMSERIDGEPGMYREAKAKLNVHPYRMYYMQLIPDDGVELLYNRETYGNKVIVNPNCFPWFNLSLSPDGRILRKNRHHTVFDLGFSYIYKVTSKFLDKFSRQEMIKIIYAGEDRINLMDCHVITIENEGFLFYRYQSSEKETLTQVAEKFGLSDYMLLERNPGVGWYDTPLRKEKIVIPNTYARKVVYYLEKTTMLPVKVKVFDDLGLFEVVEFSNIDVDPAFTEEDFVKDNPEYGF